MIKILAYKITSLFLVFMLFTHNLNTIVVIVNFMANQDFIAKTLCIQKEKQNGCHGKCQLIKELAQSNTESKDKLPLQENKRVSLDIYCLFSNYEAETPQSINISQQNNDSIQTSKTIKNPFDVEVPPPIFS